MTTDELKKLIEKGIPGASVTVTDLTGSGDHFRADVVAGAFKGKTLIEQHQLVYAALGKLMGGPIHALQLNTKPT